MNILDTIIAQKRIEVAERKANRPITVLEKTSGCKRETISFEKFLLDVSRTGIIAEFKRRSPSKGIINATADVVAVTTAYAANGASAISVLTDELFFGGSTADLEAARVNQIPILRKDFIIDEYQLVESRSMGADVILLIASCLSPLEVERLAKTARALGLGVLLELHGEEELGHVNAFTPVVGINNRNLKTFTVDINRSLAMAAQLPPQTIKVAESGIDKVENVRIFKDHGFRGFLIGELFMKAPDPGLAFQQFVNELNKVSV
ncbi:indole-3-glycerol phosphate synthase TrpC [Flavihumibacter profundi]|jgi:indole-3-glycerol phosphate synthase|uniref:indole-3-glycerol phosphate synthase TrpC n=1 Tax=Flavihumibacter profundi TaxID=2716883 RepID=UPI001CC6FDF5|nr:indole-3-glycerol phosphate synthase TrpC [Flavihumibacter profundi]MBZ5856636.1 indole-3-glycerol phosphate synthase TrpC [Flavihumibacter profundi]